MKHRCHLRRQSAPSDVCTQCVGFTIVNPSQGKQLVAPQKGALLYGKVRVDPRQCLPEGKRRRERMTKVLYKPCFESFDGNSKFSAQNYLSRTKSGSIPSLSMTSYEPTSKRYVSHVVPYVISLLPSYSQKSRLCGALYTVVVPSQSHNLALPFRRSYIDNLVRGMELREMERMNKLSLTQLRGLTQSHVVKYVKVLTIARLSNAEATSLYSFLFEIDDHLSILSSNHQ